jgi:hypothetical protein
MDREYFGFKTKPQKSTCQRTAKRQKNKKDGKKKERKKERKKGRHDSIASRIFLYFPTTSPWPGKDIGGNNYLLSFLHPFVIIILLLPFLPPFSLSFTRKQFFTRSTIPSTAGRH